MWYKELEKQKEVTVAEVERERTKIIIWGC